MEGKEYGFVKLWRKMTEWEWYTDANTKSVFLHLIILANHEDKRWQGITIKRGQLVTSLRHLSEQLKLGVQTVRTSLNKLEKSGTITKKSTNKFTLITVENYTLYQSKDEPTNKQLTNEQQTTNKQLTTNKNDKNNKKDKNIYLSSGKKPFGRFNNVYLSDQEREQLTDAYQNSNKLVDAVSGWFAENGTTSKNHYATCLKFADRGDHPKKRLQEKPMEQTERTPEQEQAINKARAETIKLLERMKK